MWAAVPQHHEQVPTSETSWDQNERDLVMGLLSSRQGLGPVSLGSLLLQQFLLDAVPQLSLGRVGMGNDVQLFLCFIFTHLLLDDSIKHFLISPAAKKLWGAAPVSSGGAGMGHLGAPETSSASSSSAHIPLPFLSATAMGWSLSLLPGRNLCYRHAHTVRVDSHFPGVVPSDPPLSGLAFQERCKRCTLQTLQSRWSPQEDKGNSASASLI